MNERCEIDRMAFVFTTDGQGKVIERCPGCEHRKRHLCMDCGGHVVGRSWRCERHKRKAQQRHTQAHHCRHQKKRNAHWRRYYAALPAEVRERRLLEKKRWRIQHPEKVREYKRMARERHPHNASGYESRQTYLEYQHQYNLVRAEAKRELMKTKAKFYGREPECAKCGVVVPWDRIGRPRKYCGPCHPWRKD